MSEQVVTEHVTGGWTSSLPGPESRSGKSAGWDGEEVLRKKADFSGSFLVTGETGGDQEQPGNKIV